MPKRSIIAPKAPGSRLDMNETAYRVLQITTGALPNPDKQKDPIAVEMGRRGGLKGGKIRMASLSPAERSALGKKAAAKRWSR